jgi:hypothetical protein
MASTQMKVTNSKAGPPLHSQLQILQPHTAQRFILHVLLLLLLLTLALFVAGPALLLLLSPALKQGQHLVSFCSQLGCCSSYLCTYQLLSVRCPAAAAAAAAAADGCWSAAARSLGCPAAATSWLLLQGRTATQDSLAAVAAAAAANTTAAAGAGCAVLMTELKLWW